MYHAQNAKIHDSSFFARRGALRRWNAMNSWKRFSGSRFETSAASIDAETKTEQELLEQDDSLFESVDMENFDIDVIKEEIGGNASFASLLTDESDSDEGEVVDETLLVSNCGLMPETVANLEARGIKALFPIQKMVFEPIKEGRDVVARAKTGSGKTLAFALPVVEKIIDSFGGERKPHGRSPQCLVLAPTRELAKQVEREFASVAGNLDVGCFYGGAPIFSQKKMLQRGIDVVVGTPGRLIDLIDQNSLDLSEIKFVILDEADQMLNVGFEQDVEDILKNVPEERQTMMFSATLPRWVKSLVKQYLNDPANIDAIGEGQTGKMAETITAYGVQVTSSSRRSILVDVITVYAEGGKTIVFTQTKRDADEVSAAIALHMPCEPLHGDMAQAERERVLASFRAGRTSVLVATDIAARGLDIPEVDLVVHYELPRDPEAFLHRSGRTGRAGRSGTAIAMYTRNEIGYFKRILRETETQGVTVISPPSPRQVVEAAAKQVMYRLDNVDEEVRSYFSPVAKMVLSSRDPQEALEVALAALSGINSIPEPRSLLTLQEGFTTLQMMSKPGRITRIGHIPAIVSRILDSRDKASQVGRIMLIDDDSTQLQGAAFDVPKDLAEEILSKQADLEEKGVTVSCPTSLPEEEGLYDRRGSRNFKKGDDDFFEKRRNGGFKGRSRFDDRRSSGGRFRDDRRSSGGRSSFSRDGGRDRRFRDDNNRDRKFRDGGDRDFRRDRGPSGSSRRGNWDFGDSPGGKGKVFGPDSW
jgi:ATP-dependent RNA helicase DDX21